jgi:hypothetical protein
MKLKLDENLGRRCAQVFQEAGFDVATVPGQKLSSAGDEKVIDVCQSEQRCLVTLDHDFANPFLFPPWEYSGIAVVRFRGQPTVHDLVSLCETLAAALAQDEISGKLWIVQPGRIREYQPDRADD